MISIPFNYYQNTLSTYDQPSEASRIILFILLTYNISFYDYVNFLFCICYHRHIQEQKVLLLLYSQEQHQEEKN